MTTTTTIVTHHGLFHADDVFAVTLLEDTLLQTRVIRTRDTRLTAAAPDRIVVDVGGVYDPTIRCFDHHQRDGRRPPRSNGIPHSSFGLVWEHYGRDYILKMWGPMQAPALEMIWADIDRTLVSGIDAADCGFPLTDIRPGFEGCGFSLSKAIASINPPYGSTRKDADMAFDVAKRVASNILHAAVANMHSAIKEAEYVTGCMDIREDPRVLQLMRGATWAGRVEETEVLFVLFPAETNDTWMVQCVPPVKGSFAQKKPLPEEWAGLRDAALVELTGVTDAVFCHPNRFICGARSFEGAERLLQLALNA